MLTKLCDITFFKEIKTKLATYLIQIAQVKTQVTDLAYLFKVSSTLCFDIFEISNTEFALRGL